ncbi:putative dehydrogenase [Actinoalloteichus hoggarensis]|uniref:Putative oxidoreductase YcjS n=1 Tax=Actinoalloteichus hoggarensis TaxID=1470176 RepID=A0A221W727_9PSEU|nr:Gfo/Idh/MocA family oxidoreductase [Actinoalloteichus hoggarensis]ASO21483.1 putative oxidoreductase YcjS [Actinoalloteichus hoggarensis]MBB5922072.1 putative dehydrogenase [Actinoalloteichus hoggarensis]
MIGTGDIADGRHLPALAASADVEVVAAVDVDPDRARDRAARWNIPSSYSDVETMLTREQPDLVVICTPPAVHREQAVAALRAGAWVWCEKPPCRSLAEYDEITAAEGGSQTTAAEGGSQTPAAEGGDRTQVGPYAAFVFQHRFGSGAEHARHLISEGRLGAPYVALCQTTWYRDDAYYAVPWRGRWDTEGGGPAMGHGIHQVDLLLELMGDWIEVRAMAGRLARDVQTEDVSTALVHFASGAMGSVVNSVLSPQETSRIRVDLADATVELNHVYGYTNDDWTYTPARHVPAEQVASWGTPSTDETGSHAAQLADVLAAMRAGRRPRCSGADGRRSLEFTTAMYKAAVTGRPVRAGEIVEGDPFYTDPSGGRTDWTLGAPSGGHSGPGRTTSDGD